MRRIIIHAGFHKTGTTSLQQTLRANRAALRPDIRLVLRPGMTALCESARAFSRSREDYDLGLVKYEAALLAEKLEDEEADTIVITSEDLSGHMPGRHKLHGYGATPHLMRALAVSFSAAAPDAELTFFFTTRGADPWLRSCYAQHLRASRMVWDEEDYLKRFKTSADLDQILDLIKREIPNHALLDTSLEEHAGRRLGLAEAMLDQLKLSNERRAVLKPAKNRNAAPSDALKAELLALNRSDLGNAALKQAKRDLIEGQKHAS
ncbi:hypothetical protein [Sulfitobacter donghicola]|uniref:Sulfotransferase domain-containing protein n=1 Tax=Sulfitobacter donghicola DSW-25 = KCTC 12864 = JCM 14565 TaxID=1300350 RepID=A0A073ING1_9RHOB|nr:hypothetical protein [Sulfitobacter donghicola]KEJ91095.1 hypothetical protein DSW25_03430 [Sulfitobacter donghicola DSW-25 = KCTC 12864 = JCM 14565]KIN68250.1 hypothetical protein Z948_1979 [Sulfitobacter donghicola DSW-25 = KCTC 12864 = JCM 14565]